MYKTLYFCFAGALLLFSVIVVNIAPAINGLIPGAYWSSLSCSYINDQHKYTKKEKVPEDYPTQEEKDVEVDSLKKEKNRCERKKAMVGLEYTALNINLVCGFICTLLGFFHFFNIGEMGKIPSFAGLGTGIVGFVLTLVYVIESGLVFNDIDGQKAIRIDSDGAFLKWDNSRNSYVCKYYDKDNKDSLYLKYSDYGNKFLNYNKDVYFKEQEKKYEYYPHSIDHGNFNNVDVHRGGCNYYDDLNAYSLFSQCKSYDEKKDNLDKLEYFDESGNKKGDCNKIFYIDYDVTDNEKKKIYDHWLTTIILSCFIIIFDIALALFGFLLMSNSNKGY